MRSREENTDYIVFLDSVKEVNALASGEILKAPLVDSETYKPVGKDFLLKVGETRSRSISIEVGYLPEGSTRRNAEQVYAKIRDDKSGFDRLIKEGMLISRFGDSWRITIVNNPEYYMSSKE
jgi:hypothetical protein